MREVQARAIADAVARLCVRANCFLPPELKGAIQTAARVERSDTGRSVFQAMLRNIEIAESEEIPVCQDTGMAVVFAEVGQDAHITGGAFEDAVNEGVRRGYVDGLLRLSVVADPLRRVNTGDNTPAVIHTRIVPGDAVRLTVCPKGFGSENMSALKMFSPSAAEEDIVSFVAETVEKAGANPCPPVVVGVGIGGTAEQVMLAAKQALLQPVGRPYGDAFYEALRARILERINRLGVGPQGLGGTVTALGVNIEVRPTHIAGLPCAVNMSCHVTRHAEETL